MECKECREMPLSKPLVVLIETYWNVKWTGKNNIICYLSINRNILECKGYSCDNIVSCIVVLIETYWNVKEVVMLSGIRSGFVLIETYWNVKVYLRLLFVIPLFGINRNILECKDNRTRNLQYLGYSINRNILECKERNQGDR